MFKNKKIIGVCGSYLFNQQPIQLINELRIQGIKHGYCIIALSLSTDTVEDTNETLGNHEFIEIIRHIPLCGMVLLSAAIKNTGLAEHVKNICQEENIPVFSIDGQFDGCYNMMMDHSGGFEKVVRHVVEEHGCRKVNMLAGWKGDYFSEQRISAYKKVLQENSIPIEEERIKYGDFWDIPARKAVNEFLKSPLPFPEAICCANDSMAIATCSELQKFGYSVPKDIIITGFDGIPSAKFHFPVLTTCEPDFQEAAEFIVNEIENFYTTKHFTPFDHCINFSPTIQQSCGCQPKTVRNLSQAVSDLYDSLGDCSWHNISMNELITANLNNDSIIELSKIIPEHIHLWKEHFRFACVKSSMLSSDEVEDNFTDMISIFNIRSSNFSTVNEIFPVGDIVPGFNDIEEADTFIIRLLNSGKTVYGYSVEGFHEINDRKLQRCNDFAIFLSYCLNTIIHNAKQKKLTEGLIKANDEISMMSLHDPMTGLYNRRGFYHKMKKILGDESNLGKYLYIFSIDMNRLKYVNDTFGHTEGDFSIITLANSIHNVSGSDSICARFGGDEFIVVLLNYSNDIYSSTEFCLKLHNDIASSNAIKQKPYKIQASVGMSCHQITPSINIETMISDADACMYEMKKNKKQD